MYIHMYVSSLLLIVMCSLKGYILDRLGVYKVLLTDNNLVPRQVLAPPDGKEAAGTCWNVLVSSTD